MHAPDFHRVTWYDRWRFRRWERAAFAIEAIGRRQAALEALWTAWVSRWPGTLPPSARLVEWHARRMSL
jgi:hypothetical protein